MYMDVHQHDHLVDYLIMHGSHIGFMLIRYLFYMTYLCSKRSGHWNHRSTYNRSYGHLPFPDVSMATKLNFTELCICPTCTVCQDIKLMVKKLWTFYKFNLFPMLPSGKYSE